MEQEAENLTQAVKYERNEARKGYRSGHYDRNLITTSGDVTLHVPCLKGVSFETAIIEDITALTVSGSALARYFDCGVTGMNNDLRTFLFNIVWYIYLYDLRY